jgi:hypothetical protein
MSRGRLAGLAVVAVAVVAVVAYLVAARTGRSPQGPTVSPTFLNGVSDGRYAPPIPKHGAYFGAWVRDGPYTQPNQIVALDRLQRTLGRRLDIVHTYLRWEAAFPRTSELAALRQGSMLLVSWTGADSVGVASGRYDSVIRLRARQLKALHKPVFLEWRWEMDRNNLRGVVGTPGEFIAAWRHVRAVFAHEAVNNVAWVWCPTAKGFQPGGNAPAYYPGTSQVDWICADAYPGYGPYRSFSDAAGPFLSWATHYRRPVMIGEYGVQRSYGPQQRARWLLAAAQTVRDDPQIKALVYFDSDPAGSAPVSAMAIDYGTAPMQAFRRIARSRYFNPGRLQVSD